MSSLRIYSYPAVRHCRSRVRIRGHDMPARQDERWGAKVGLGRSVGRLIINPTAPAERQKPIFLARTGTKRQS